MSDNKSIPFFKIIAILCLAIVCIVEIMTMTDYAEVYKLTAQEMDAEYLTIFYYIMGFSFLAVAFSAVLSCGKRKYAIVSASVEFLVILACGYYLKEFYKPTQETEELMLLILSIPVIYVEETWLVIGISATALVFGILDVTADNIFSLSSNTNECIYCGRRLRLGEKCTCDLDDTYVINDFETDPENYADDVEKRRCAFCGRLLYGTEECNCLGAKRKKAEDEVRRRGPIGMDDTPKYTPPSPRDMYPPADTPPYTPDRSKPAPRKGFINPEFKTNPGLKSGGFSTPPSGSSTTPPSKKPGDERFFSKPNDL